MNDHKKFLQKKKFFTTTDQFLGVWDLETNNFFGLALVHYDFLATPTGEFM